METIVRKDRIRENKGKLHNFYDLPLIHQKNFTIIKNRLQKEFGEAINVYVFGSFYWGFWDEDSDYDVKLDYIFNGYKPDNRLPKIKEISLELKEFIGKKVDVLIMQGEFGILIP